ncbi:uncharacterized protein LOC116202923 [Punica granatum]|uniref:Uncharacterized protein LOC116202923 n=1 Tax=Punica granatum TaxID=22663 RepID=A0A6P8D206_PUNGR|nr:uncharacterized protein LOC116202923 [Punica granatum]
MALLSYSLPSILLIVATSLHATNAVEYVVSNTVPNTEGGAIFRDKLGQDYARQTMASASEFIWQTLRQPNEADRKPIARVTLVVENFEGIAYTINSSEIHVSANSYIRNIKGDIKTDFNGVLYHEMTHVWQWDGKRQGHAPNVTEGVADFVRLRANYAPPTWPPRGSGQFWHEGYAVTAYFLDYCEGLKNGFVADLNMKMKDGYNDSFFMELLGKPVDQLWSEYKARYGN